MLTRIIQVKHILMLEAPT